MTDFDAATDFIHRTARLLERHRFAHLFLGADAEPVVRTLRAYRNPDGGFGNALEPDLRDPASQPPAGQTALEVLHEAGTPDAELIGGACEFLMSITRPDGAIPFVLPSAADYPRSPWWQPADESSLTQTAANAAALHALGSDHAWLEGADAYIWRRIEALDFLGSAYDTLFTFGFLDTVPDGERAQAALETLRPHIDEIVGDDPAAPAESHSTLDFSPRPDCRSRRLFEPERIERDLDTLAAAQLPDGGWTFDWPSWAPAVEQEWRGVITLNALKTLRAAGRLSG